jgi:hypothetical protein
MAMTTVDATRPVTGGVNTHLDVNVAAALDPIGGLLGVAEFPTTPAEHRELAEFLASFGTLARVGVEGTGSYGAGLSRYLRTAGVEVVEVDRPNRQSRRRTGKSDPVDAIEAARAALSGRAQGAGKSRDGNVEAIRALVVAKRSSRSRKIQTLNQIRHLGFTAPEELRSVDHCATPLERSARCQFQRGPLLRSTEATRVPHALLRHPGCLWCPSCVYLAQLAL